MIMLIYCAIKYGLYNASALVLQLCLLVLLHKFVSEHEQSAATKGKLCCERSAKINRLQAVNLIER